MTYGTQRYDLRIQRSADEVWKVLSQLDSLPLWFPGVVSCVIEDDVRHVELPTGMKLPERMITVDHILKRLQYQLDLPVLTHHRTTVDVIELGESECIVIYSTDADPRILALTMGAGTGQALYGLRDYVEHGVLANSATASSTTSSTT